MKIMAIYTLEGNEHLSGPFLQEEEAWLWLEKTKKKLAKKACDKESFELQFDESCFVEITEIYNNGDL